jgi:hypothetical protein
MNNNFSLTLPVLLFWSCFCNSSHLKKKDADGHPFNMVVISSELLMPGLILLLFWYKNLITRHKMQDSCYPCLYRILEIRTNY